MSTILVFFTMSTVQNQLFSQALEKSLYITVQPAVHRGVLVLGKNASSSAEELLASSSL